MTFVVHPEVSTVNSQCQQQDLFVFMLILDLKLAHKQDIIQAIVDRSLFSTS